MPSLCYVCAFAVLRAADCDFLVPFQTFVATGHTSILFVCLQYDAVDNICHLRSGLRSAMPGLYSYDECVLQIYAVDDICC